MLEFLSDWQRTSYCGQFNTSDIGKEVIAIGWVQKHRDLGSLRFVDLRDRSGILQVEFDTQKNETLHQKAKLLKNEYVIAVKGKIISRPAGAVNAQMATGEIELEASELRILNDADVPPFVVGDDKVSEELRLRYRYLDLRHQRMQKNVLIRHKAMQATRHFLNQRDFLELETPMLIKNTPEGAREYVVPSRLYEGKFYALPQSPQMFKQLYMIGGFDRYYQIARCFRDEDLRADRQPEFTQIDIEMSFASQEEIFAVTEGLMKSIWKETIDFDLPTPFPRMTYHESMERFGTDKPDLRFGMELKDISEDIANCEFGVFAQALQAGGVVKAIAAPGAAKFSRKHIDELTRIAKDLDAQGLPWTKVQEKDCTGGIAKFLSDTEKQAILQKLNAQDGDLILFGSDSWATVSKVLGGLRNVLAKPEWLNLADPNEFNCLWITDFPMFEKDEETGNWAPLHHMFTMPKEDSLAYLETNPGKVIGQLYDVVCNGVELSSGSIRVHRQDVQQKIFEIIGFDADELERKFGFFLEALKYGTPPHGGIAPGFDRIIMLLAKESNIRDVIAFPKTLRAVDLMSGSPSIVDESLLEELNLKIVEKKS